MLFASYQKSASPINDFSFAQKSTQIHQKANCLKKIYRQKDITRSYPI
jgi:hypothetical protein